MKCKLLIFKREASIRTNVQSFTKTRKVEVGSAGISYKGLNCL